MASKGLTSKIYTHFLTKMKEQSEKVGLKPNIQKTKIMATGPNTSWRVDGETVAEFFHFFGGGLQNNSDISLG